MTGLTIWHWLPCGQQSLGALLIPDCVGVAPEAPVQSRRRGESQSNTAKKIVPTTRATDIDPKFPFPSTQIPRLLVVNSMWTWQTELVLILIPYLYELTTLLTWTSRLDAVGASHAGLESHEALTPHPLSESSVVDLFRPMRMMSTPRQIPNSFDLDLNNRL